MKQNNSNALFLELPAALYVVSTPIGNLKDISLRAVEILKTVDLILAEDTRHTRQLLTHLNIQKSLQALHEHNERTKAETLIDRIKAGETMALVSDAGTPLISDPGYYLVRLSQAAGVKVVPIPGASAMLTALVASGLPTDRFIFAGFLPSKKRDRHNSLENLRTETCTLIFYEAPHRLLETLQDMQDIFGENREAVLARELTKTFETVKRSTLAELARWVKETDQARGEIVILVHGANASETILSKEVDKILAVLLKALPTPTAVQLAAKITNISKRTLYQRALEIQRKK